MLTAKQPPTNGSPETIDDVFLAILTGLTQALLTTVQSASEQVLNLSSQFLDANVSDALTDFQALYQDNPALDSYKTSVAKNVDDIIHFVQNNTAIDAKDEKRILDKIDSDQLMASRLSLSKLQSDMESLVVLDSDLKNQILPILHNMQFEDQLSSNVTMVTDVWEYFIDQTHNNNNPDIKVMAKTIYDKLTAEKLRRLFCDNVLLCCNALDARLDEQVAESFVQNLAAEGPLEDFMTRMEKYCTQVFQWGSEDSAASTTLIIDIINIIQDKAQNSGDFSDESKDAFSNLSEIAMGFNSPHKRESTKILVSLMKNRFDVKENIQALVQPIMMAMQFQDRIRQNMENLSKLLLIWISSRRDHDDEKTLSDETLTNIGTKILDCMTMTSEKDVIYTHIPQVADQGDEDEDGIDLF